jgi:glycosyltransferase involved in cell wall biosynthesis
LNIGVLVSSVSRRGAGVQEASREMARAVFRSGSADVTVYAPYDEYTKRDVHAWLPLRPRIYRTWWPGQFGYSRSIGANLLAGKHDILHVHGLWLYPTMAARKWGRRTNRPVVVSIHGMLAGWALKRSRLKKWMASIAFQGDALRIAGCIHAMNHVEVEQIRAYGLRNPVCVVPNGVGLTCKQHSGIPVWRRLMPRKSRVLLFLGRLHPVKGLDELLRAWSLVHVGDDAKQWQLVVAGWDEGGYGREMRRLAQSLGIKGSLRFIGPQVGVARDATYAASDAFILPSRAECLPMAPLEAWQAGLPVLMTRACNLSAGFRAGCGNEVHLDPRIMAKEIVAFFSLSDAQRRKIGLCGRAFVNRNFSWRRSAAQMLLVYRWLVGGGSPPSCVVLS